MLKNSTSLIDFLNRILQSDLFNKSIPDKFLSDIDNKKIKINLKDIDYSITLYIKDNTLMLLDEKDSYDVELIATPATLVLFIFSKGSDKFSSKIIINGDIETANKFNNFLSSSEKVKEIIIHLMGDDKAYKLENKVQKITSFLGDFFQSSSNDIIDLLIDDLSVLPSKKEINMYLDEVDNLKSRTDQLYQKYKNVK